MDGIGEKLAEQLCEEGFVKSLPDLYALTHSDLVGLERMGEKSAANVITQLDSTRSLNLSAFLSALGLPGIGPELASAFPRYVGESTTLFDLLAEPDRCLPPLAQLHTLGVTGIRHLPHSRD